MALFPFRQANNPFYSDYLYIYLLFRMISPNNGQTQQVKLRSKVLRINFIQRDSQSVSQWDFQTASLWVRQSVRQSARQQDNQSMRQSVRRPVSVTNSQCYSQSVSKTASQWDSQSTESVSQIFLILSTHYTSPWLCLSLLGLFRNCSFPENGAYALKESLSCCKYFFFFAYSKRSWFLLHTGTRLNFFYNQRSPRLWEKVTVCMHFS